MCHKRDSLDKCFHVSLKILDPGIQDVASLTPSSEGEDTQDRDVKGDISVGAAAPGECLILSYFLYFFHACSIVVRWGTMSNYRVFQKFVPTVNCRRKTK